MRSQTTSLTHFLGPIRTLRTLTCTHAPSVLAGAPTSPAPSCRRSKIRDQINNLVLKEPQTWHTAVGLPFLQIEGTVRAAFSFPLPAWP